MTASRNVSIMAADVDPSGVLTILGGGTGANTAADALTALGAQATLIGTNVAGQNLKTLNGITLLGKGDITVSGGSGGGVSSVSFSNANGVSGTVTSPTSTPVISISLGDITPTSVTATGTISGSNLSGTNTGNQTISLTGDVTGSGTGSFVATLATMSGLTAAQYPVATVTVDPKGRVTAISSALSSSIPLANGTASAGTSTTVSRSDHIHPAGSGSISLSQTFYLGTTPVTIGQALGTVNSLAVSVSGSAGSLAGGSSGSIPYQTGSSTTMLAAGADGQVLTYNGASNTPQWTTLASLPASGISITNDSTNSTPVYLTWVTTTGSTTVSVSSSKLSFVPSTGTLSVTGLSASGNASVLGAISNSDLRLYVNQINATSTNGLGEIALNYVGYNSGTTQFRNLTIYDGKSAQIASFTGSTKSLTVAGSMSANGVVSSSGISNSNGWFSTYYNTSGLYPTAASGTSISWNTSGGARETDFWNTDTSASTSFNFYQLTGVSTKTLILSISPSGALTGVTSVSGTASSANSVTGGVTNQLLYQTGAGTTGFVSVPSTSSTYLQWNGSTFVWASPSGFSAVDDTSTNATYYPAFITSAGGSSVKTDSIHFKYTPSTGALVATSFNGITSLSSSIPLANGTASAGTSTTVSRSDHIHPAGSASSLTGGGSGSIPYQSSSGVTTFLGAGAAGYYMTMNPGGTAPQWTQLPSSSLGFTPVQQGTGTGQNANTVKIGWADPSLLLQVDLTNFGSIWPITAKYANSATTTVPSDSSTSIATTAYVKSQNYLTGITSSAVATAVAPVVTNLGSYTLNASTPNARVQPVTSPGNTGGYNVGAGEMEVTFDLVTSAFFSGNDAGGAHLAVVARCDTSLTNIAVRGQGMIIGNVSGNTNGGAPNHPTTQIETWFNGFGSNNYLPPESAGYASKPMADGVNYRIVLSTKVLVDGTSYIRYRLYRYDTTYNSTNLTLERDTGDVQDTNSYIDKTMSGLVFGYVFTTVGAPAWSINITNLTVVWKPVTTVASEMPSWMLTSANTGGPITISTATSAGLLNTSSSTWGIRHTGSYIVGIDLSTASHSSVGGGYGSAIRIKANDYITFDAFDQFRMKLNSTNSCIEFYNNATRHGYINLSSGSDVDLAAGGSGGVTSFNGSTGAIIFNSSSITTQLGFTPTRQLGSNAVLIGWYGSELVSQVDSSYFGSVWPMKSQGISIPGATYSVDGSVSIGYSANKVNWGGPNAYAFSAGSAGSGALDVDAVCSIGFIASFATSPNGIETAMRPLWCLFSSLIKHLQDKKLI